MSNQLGFTRRADNPKTGLTIGELYAFIQETEALNLDPRTPIKVSIGWRQQVQTITAGERP